MTYFVSTALGFITNNKIDREFPKQCIDQSRSKDVRWAFPFNTWDEANRFATELTSGPHWPPSSRYYAIMTSASPNIKPSPEEYTPEIQSHQEPGRLRLGDRLRTLLS